jgi:hypothetical protein
MKHRDITNPNARQVSATQRTLSVLRWLLELVAGIVLAASTAASVRVPVQPRFQGASAPGHRKRPTPALRWRGPWWAWQLVSLVIATLTAPTFLLVGSLLLIDSHSDHPFFWWSLPAIVASGNAIAILHTNQQHHRRPFINRRSLARHHAATGAMAGAGLFLLTGWTSGFLSDFATSMAGISGAVTPVAAAALWSVALAGAFGLLSFAHAGTVHAWLGYRAPAIPNDR